MLSVCMTSFRLVSQASMHVPRNFPEPNLYHPYFRNTKLYESKLVHSQFSIHCLSLGMGMRLEVELSSQLYNFLHMACYATPPHTHTHTLQRISSLMMRSRTLLNKSKRCNRLQCPREPHPNNTTQPLYVIFALLPMHKL